MTIVSLPQPQPPPETDSAADHWYAIADIPKQPQWKCLNRRLLYREIAEGRPDAAGGDWPTRARAAAMKLMGFAARQKQEADQNLALELLADVRAIFAANDNPEKLATKDIVAGLVALEDRPWGDVHEGRQAHQRPPPLPAPEGLRRPKTSQAPRWRRDLPRL